MIKNIIFDVGNVLMDYNPDKFMERFPYDETTKKELIAAMNGSEKWNEFDRSSCSDEEMLQSFIENAPQHEEKIRTLFDNMEYIVTTFPYAREWVGSYKKRGYKTFILSNFPRKIYELKKESMDFLSEVDGAVFSFQVKLVKPEPEIYQELLSQFHLKPEECLFLDDSKKNIEMARKLGIQAIVVESQKQAIEDVEKILRES